MFTETCQQFEYGTITKKAETATTIDLYIEPWGLNYLNQTGETLSVNTQDAVPNGIEFNATGTKIFMVGNTADKVFEYTISSAYDFSSTLAYSGNSYDPTAQATAPTDVAFNVAGTKMFIVDTVSDAVYEYTIATGFDLSTTVTYTTNNQDVSSEDLAPVGVCFNTAGTKMFVLGGQNKTIYEYTLSTGFDLGSTVAYSGNSYVLPTVIGSPTSFAFNSDGTELFIVQNGASNDYVFRFSLSTAFDITSTVTQVNAWNINADVTGGRGIALGGGNVYLSNQGATGEVVEYTLAAKTLYNYPLLITLSASFDTDGVFSDLGDGWGKLWIWDDDPTYGTGNAYRFYVESWSAANSYARVWAVASEITGDRRYITLDFAASNDENTECGSIAMFGP